MSAASRIEVRHEREAANGAHQSFTHRAEQLNSLLPQNFPVNLSI